MGYVGCPHCAKTIADTASACSYCGGATDAATRAVLSASKPGSRVYFWDKVYTRAQLMRESRWLLLFIGVLMCAAAALLISSAPSPDDASDEAYGMVMLGPIFVVAALVPSFWLRFGVCALWAVSLATGVATGIARPITFFYLTALSIFLYKMWKYRDAGVVGAQKETAG